MTQYHVYGMGAALVDTEIEVEDRFLEACGIDKGLMTLVDEQRQQELTERLENHLRQSKRASGGSAANTIIANSYFGGHSYYSCKVADDENGDFYLHDLKAAGVDSDFDSVRPAGITGKCLVMITPDAERSMNTFLGISETLSKDNLNLSALADSDYLYMEGYLVTSDTGRAAAISAREYAESKGVKTALSLSDPGMVQFFKDGLSQMIGDKVDLLFCNKDEALGWAETDDLETAITAIKKISNSFAITLGAEGALVFDGETQFEIAPHKVEAIDSNGAGDAFAGAFLYGLSQGWGFAKAGKLASLTSATVVTQFGPRLDKQGYENVLATFDQ